VCNRNKELDMTAKPASTLSTDAPTKLRTGARTMEFWDAWAFAAVESGLALEAWMSASHEEKELGYFAYLASLDREEKAAAALAERVDPAAAARLSGGG
jgi:hypothetical protein